MRKHLRAAVMLGMMASGAAWADTDTDDQESESATGDTVREPESGPRSVLPQSVEQIGRAHV